MCARERERKAVCVHVCARIALLPGMPLWRGCRTDFSRCVCIEIMQKPCFAWFRLACGRVGIATFCSLAEKSFRYMARRGESSRPLANSVVYNARAVRLCLLPRVLRIAVKSGLDFGGKRIALPPQSTCQEQTTCRSARLRP